VTAAGLRRRGTVVAFDEAAGLGEVEASGAGAAGAGAGAGAAERAEGAAGAARYPFHCTQIADGSRVVAVGAPVSFGLLAGRGGRWEAADIRSGGSVTSGA
jgi:CspA family cold shock protein